MVKKIGIVIILIIISFLYGCFTPHYKNYIKGNMHDIENAYMHDSIQLQIADTCLHVNKFYVRNIESKKCDDNYLKEFFMDLLFRDLDQSIKYSLIDTVISYVGTVENNRGTAINLYKFQLFVSEDHIIRYILGININQNSIRSIILLSRSEKFFLCSYNLRKDFLAHYFVEKGRFEIIKDDTPADVILSKEAIKQLFEKQRKKYLKERKRIVILLDDGTLKTVNKNQ